MCTICGCSTGSAPSLTNLQTGESLALHEAHDHQHDHGHSDEHQQAHAHGHSHAHGHPHAHHHDHGQPHSHVSSHGQPHADGTARAAATRLLGLERDLLAKNDKLAERNRGWLAGRDILALNLVSSPGSGKTTLLERTLRDLQDEQAMSVIEGDQETLNDARRIRATGCDVVQINTGTGCHLEAEMLARGLEQLDPPPHSLVWIENVGNLVCPALFDLGERCKIVIMSVTEGADKPLKYPHMFRASELMLLNKIDLLPHVSFDVAECIEGARRVNPALQVLQLSATRGDGLPEFYAWLRELRAGRVRSALRATP